MDRRSFLGGLATGAVGVFSLPYLEDVYNEQITPIPKQIGERRDAISDDIAQIQYPDSQIDGRDNAVNFYTVNQDENRFGTEIIIDTDIRFCDYLDRTDQPLRELAAEKPHVDNAFYRASVTATTQLNEFLTDQDLDEPTIDEYQIVLDGADNGSLTYNTDTATAYTTFYNNGTLDASLDAFHENMFDERTDLDLSCDRNGPIPDWVPAYDI